MQESIVKQSTKMRLTGFEIDQLRKSSQNLLKFIKSINVEVVEEPKNEKIDWSDKKWNQIVGCERKDLLRLSFSIKATDDELKKIIFKASIPFGVSLDHIGLK